MKVALSPSDGTAIIEARAVATRAAYDAGAVELRLTCSFQPRWDRAALTLAYTADLRRPHGHRSRGRVCHWVPTST